MSYCTDLNLEFSRVNNSHLFSVRNILERVPCPVRILWWGEKVNFMISRVPTGKCGNLFFSFHVSRNLTAISAVAHLSTRDLPSGTHTLHHVAFTCGLRNVLKWVLFGAKIFSFGGGCCGATVPLEGALLWAAATCECSSLLSMCIPVALRLMLQTLFWEIHITVPSTAPLILYPVTWFIITNIYTFLSMISNYRFLPSYWSTLFFRDLLISQTIGELLYSLNISFNVCFVVVVFVVVDHFFWGGGARGIYLL